MVKLQDIKQGLGNYTYLKGDRELTLQIQTKLIALGLLSIGEDDGSYGSKTDSALKTFVGYFPAIKPDNISSEFAKALIETKILVPQAGIDLIKLFESLFLKAYPDPLSGGIPITIGWGCTKKEDGSKWVLGECITKEKADYLLISQLKTQYQPIIQATVPYWAEMNSNQKGALLSFAYNLGAEFMTKGDFNIIRTGLKEKRWDDLPKILKRYHNPGSQVELGLFRRRSAEGYLWNGMDAQQAFKLSQEIKKITL
jgi:lysozyme